MGAQGTVIAVCTSAAKGEQKTPIGKGTLVPDHGLEGDAHAGTSRQVSLLARESTEEFRRGGGRASPGDLAENLSTEGLRVHLLPIGTRLRVGEEAVIEITEIGKEPHEDSPLLRRVGTSVMLTEGVFAGVVRGGEVKAGDVIEVIGDE